MAEYRIKGKKLTLTGDPAAFRYEVSICYDGCEASWTMTKTPYVKFADGTVLPFPAPASEEAYHTGTSEGFRAVYTGFGSSGITVHTHVFVENATDDVYFESRIEGDTFCEIDAVSFPAPWDFGAEPGNGYTVLSRMQGTLIPAGQRISIADGQIFERDSYMPIYGQVRGDSGYLAIYDTPYDARYQLDDDRVVPLWRTSLGTMSYPRRMLFRFLPHGDYNAMAKSYRAYVKERGRLVTLAEKAARNPNVKRLIGAAVIHEGIATHVSPDSDYYRPDHPEFNDNYTSFYTRAEQIKALKARGLNKGYTHFDGWGNHGYDNLHPSPFPPHEAAGGVEGMKALSEATREAGFLFGIHDQYRDYYYDSPDFSFDNAIQYADGGHPYCSVWYGGKHTFLCSEKAIDYVRRNYAEFERLGIVVEASYLDVFSVVQLDECFNPDHPATREQCALNRRRCLDILTDRGIIPSSEETLDCILPSQVLCHHSPFFTSNLGSAEAQPVGVPIPLFNLVYHDCVVIPWIAKKGSRGGWGIPGNDTAYAHAFLNGDPVYCSINADEETIADANEACALAEKLAYTEMVRHEFLSEDTRVQRTTFADGTVVEVNFDTEEITVR